MAFKGTILQALLSKVVTAAITTPIFSFLLGLLMSNPFGERATHWQGYLTDTIQITPIYMLYSFPVILVYGGLTSLLCDFLANNMAAYTLKRLELLYAAVFHLGFGLILLKISLLAAPRTAEQNQMERGCRHQTAVSLQPAQGRRNKAYGCKKNRVLRR